MSVDIVDVLVSDHAPPRQIEKLAGKKMVAIDGGTQALQRTVNAELEIIPGQLTTVSVPSTLGALLLKSAAYKSDSRDRGRHLYDAVHLLACVENPASERDNFHGSDRSRIRLLHNNLPMDSGLWNSLPDIHSQNARAALNILSQGLG